MTQQFLALKANAKKRWWNDRTIRARAFQIIFSLTLAMVLWLLYHNTLANMAKLGITTGFDFLDSPAGFNIASSMIAYDETMSYGRTFWVGLLNTLLVSTLGIVLATILGFVIGISRLSKNWLLSTLSSIYVDFFRNIPLLLQIFFWYFAVLRNLPSPKTSFALGDMIFLNNRGIYLPNPTALAGFGWVAAALVVTIAGIWLLRRWSSQRQERSGQTFPVWLVGIAALLIVPSLVFWLSGSPVEWEVPVLKGFNFRGGINIIPELGALLLALSIYTAAFIAEIVRSGIQSVNRGQTEAAQALGFRSNPTMRLIIIPQAMRVIIPPLTSQYLNLTKNSSLAVAVGYPDLVAVFMGTTLNQTGQAVEIVAITMLVYLLISLTISALMNLYNKAVALPER